MKKIKRFILWKIWNIVDGWNWAWFRLEHTERGLRFLSREWLKG